VTGLEPTDVEQVQSAGVVGDQEQVAVGQDRPERGAGHRDGALDPAGARREPQHRHQPGVRLVAGHLGDERPATVRHHRDRRGRQPGRAGHRGRRARRRQPGRRRGRVRAARQFRRRRHARRRLRGPRRPAAGQASRGEHHAEDSQTPAAPASSGGAPRQVSLPAPAPAAGPPPGDRSPDAVPLPWAGHDDTVSAESLSHHHRSLSPTRCFQHRLQGRQRKHGDRAALEALAPRREDEAAGPVSSRRSRRRPGRPLPPCRAAPTPRRRGGDAPTTSFWSPRPGLRP
jgi:hypothetical protein